MKFFSRSEMQEGTISVNEQSKLIVPNIVFDHNKSQLRNEFKYMRQLVFMFRILKFDNNYRTGPDRP